MDSIIERELRESRDSLRRGYMSVAKFLLACFDKFPSKYVEPSAVAHLPIVFREFEPLDERFLASDACLFEPLSLQKMERYAVDERRLSQRGKDYVNMKDFVYIPSPTTTKERLSQDPYTGSLKIRDYVQYLFCHVPRKGFKGYKTLDEISRWDGIQYGDPFLSQIGILSQTKVTEEQSWHTSLIFEALEKKNEPQPAHILIITNHEEFGSEDHLLLGDLAAPVQAIYNRLSQPGFEHTFLFPVLMLSLFGPRHARLLQLHFDASMKLNVRASKRYDFTRTREAPWDLFVRFMMSSPRIGPRLEAYIEPSEQSEDGEDGGVTVEG